LKNIKIPNFIKIRSVRVELFLEDGQADRRAEANSRISQFCKAPENESSRKMMAT